MLGIKWTFVKYTNAMWIDLRENFNKILDIYPYELCTPNLQEYFASNFISKEYGKGIFVPGYVLDTAAGNYICPDEFSFLSRLFRSKKTIVFITPRQKIGIEIS